MSDELRAARERLGALLPAFADPSRPVVIEPTGGPENFAADLRAILAALDAQAPELPETVYKAVERVLDECSAWIARPDAECTRKVAMAAGIAWSLHAPHDLDAQAQREGEPALPDGEPGLNYKMSDETRAKLDAQADAQRASAAAFLNRPGDFIVGDAQPDARALAVSVEQGGPSRDHAQTFRFALEQIKGVSDTLERLAFSMPAPNEFTPQFVMLAHGLRRIGNEVRFALSSAEQVERDSSRDEHNQTPTEEEAGG